MVQCDKLIADLPSGYETLIGSGGDVHLSGGQRQRLALARMALRNAPIVLLDEASAFVDPESEEAIQKGLSLFLKNKTVLVVAHRLSSIAHADNIIVLDKGVIAESGTHASLLEQNGVYSRLWDAWQTTRSWELCSPGTTQRSGGANV
jgi:ATP-binding cassette subfamily B protein